MPQTQPGSFMSWRCAIFAVPGQRWSSLGDFQAPGRARSPPDWPTRLGGPWCVRMRSGDSDKWASDRYAPDAVAAVYEELLRIGRRHLEQGESVILDASWVGARQRAGAAQVAQETQSELIAICCRCEDAVGADRIRERLRRGEDVSEATVAIRDAMAMRLDPWPSAVVVDTSRTPVAATVESTLRKLATASSLDGSRHDSFDSRAFG